jgi:hypothetical protein
MHAISPRFQCFAVVLALQGATCYAESVVEPFVYRIAEVRFESHSLEVSSEGRAKLKKFAQSLTSPQGIHECDFDFFVYSGVRHAETGKALKRLDELFDQRVTRFRAELSTLGVPRHIGTTMSPSEAVPEPDIELDTLLIEVRQWTHLPTEIIDAAHLACVWRAPGS